MSRGYVNVSVNLDEIFDDISDDNLVEELKRRKRTEAELKRLSGRADDRVEDGIRDALDCLRSGRTEEAALMLERLANPKWSDPDKAWEAYHEALKKTRVA